MFIDDHYHGQQPSWRDTKVTRKGELFGVELEVFHPRGRANAADALDLLNPRKYPRPLAERDGSLDRARGVEIICPPLPRKEVTEEAGYMSELLGHLRDAGVPAEQPEGYGMHINVNVVDWEPKHKVLVQYLLNKFSRTAPVIGRRTAGFGSFIPRFRYLREPGGHLSLVTYPGGKHAAAWLRGSTGVLAGTGASVVMEVRFPKATTATEHIRLAVDYVTAVREWTAAAPNHTEAVCFIGETLAGADAHVAESLFVSWCSKRYPELHKLFAEAGIEGLKGKRLETAANILSSGDLNLTTENRITHDSSSTDGAKKQILRISSLLGKGAQLAGQQDARGNTIVSTIKAAR